MIFSLHFNLWENNKSDSVLASDVDDFHIHLNTTIKSNSLSNKQSSSQIDLVALYKNFNTNNTIEETLQYI